jgi:hypothetical protein
MEFGKGSGDSTFYSPQAPPGVESFEVEQQVPKHPVTVVAHLLFKIGALVTYLTGSLAFPKESFVIPFIVTVIFIALDFWVTKNISGRLLVGLRWWNEVKPDGSNEWIFESLEKTAITNPTETKVFWGSVFILPIAWFAFLLKQIFTFSWDWGILCAIGLSMAAANVTGYIKCARDARKQVTDMATRFVVQQAVEQAVNRV